MSTNWQSGSSISSLASALQAALANPANGYSTLLSATPTSTGVTLTSLQPGTTGNLSISCTATHTSSQFSTASFATSCAGMSGGANAQYAPVTAYSYSIANSTGVPGSGYAANGNVSNVTDSVIGTWSYNYDNLNRLTGATGQSGSYGSLAVAGVNLGWSYDSFGNRFGQTSSSNNFPTSWACFVGSNNPWSACSGISGTANNRMFSSNQDSAIGYDNAGDVTNDGVNSYLYDVEGKVCGVGNSQSGFTQYLYDADGNRVAKGPVTAPLSCTVPSNFSPTYVYLLGTGGEQVTELVNGAWNYSNIYASGSLLATYRGTDTYFALKDWLGTKRVEVTPDGLTSSFTSLPFGDDLSPPIGNAIDANEQHFTGKERDAESGLDYFGARYYGSNMGRFQSPDPVIITPERLANPQELNLYAYVANNPLRFIDPTGEVLQCAGDDKSRSQCFSDLQQIAGDASSRLSMDAKTGVVSFDTSGLDLSKNAGGALVNDLVGSKNTYDFSVGPTVMTDKGPVRIDKISIDIANLPTFGDQPKSGNPPAGVSDIVGLYLNNPNITRVSNTDQKVAPEWTVAFHELAEAYAKIDGGMGGSYAAGHNAALQRENDLRDQRPYLKQYNTGAGGPANSPNPQGGIIIKK